MDRSMLPRALSPARMKQRFDYKKVCNENNARRMTDLWIRVIVRQVFDISSNTGHVHLHVVFLTFHCKENNEIKT